MTTILCFSRSYLARLLPTLDARDPGATYLHIAQTEAEAALIRSRGGTVVLVVETAVRDAWASAPDVWVEPGDFRKVTGCDWSPIALDRYMGSFSHADRQRIAAILYAKANELFHTNRIDFFLNEPVAHFLGHVIYYLSRRAGVQQLLWCNTYFPGYFYFSENLDISRASRKVSMSSAEGKVLRERVASYAHGVAADRVGPIYHHSFTRDRSKKPGLFRARKGFAPYVVKPGLVAILFQTLRLGRSIMRRALFRRHGDYISAGSVREHLFYLRCLIARPVGYDAIPAEFSDSNVVYPLQYEPEASLLYFAPEIVDQFSFVETVLRALPSDKRLWVKEHPNQFGALRAQRWRDLKARYHNLKFVHGRQSGRSLIRVSSLIVTISSTMGLDGLLMGRKLLVAGRVFFNQFTGAKRIQSYADLATELNDADNFVIGEQIEDNIEEMVAFGRRCYPGDPQPAEILYSDENIDHLVRAIVEQTGRSPSSAADSKPIANLEG